MKKAFKIVFLYVLFIGPKSAFGQSIPAVPTKIRMFGVNLILEDGPRQVIEKDMAYLAQKRSYLDVKLANMAVYFPIIENIFEQNNVPKEFKYLCAQESSFIADAVSSSNAVGYWQFKASTATDHGLRVDDVVDERKNIVSATWAAASYLKNNNRVLQNWVSTLLSYRLGLTGAKAEIPAEWYNATEITITNKVDWYVLRNIAHFIFFENELEHFQASGKSLNLYANAGGKTFENIALDLKLPLADLKKQNTWCNCEQIPQDKNYTIVSFQNNGKANSELLGKKPVSVYEKPVFANNNPFFDIEIGYPVLAKNEKKSKKLGATFYTINGKDGILSKSGDTPEIIAERGQLKAKYFKDYNDLGPSDAIVSNTVYYLERKNKKSKNAEFHIVKNGQSMWLISQMYGIRERKLQRLNRMKNNESLQTGRKLHLLKRLGRNEKIEIIRNSLPLGNEQLPTEKPQILISNPTNTLPTAIEKAKPNSNTANEVLVENTNYNNTGERPVLVREREPFVPKKEIEKSASAAEQPTTDYHTVKAGETMFAIATKYNLKVADLKAMNNKTSYDVQIGERLVLNTTKTTAPVNTSKPVSNKKDIEHIVQPGETLYRISVKYAVSVDKLKTDNALNSNTIATGQTLKIVK